MDTGYWKKTWEEGNIRFHRDKPHSQLVRFGLPLGAETSASRVMVPLCGKSLDLLWLQAQGHEVVGAELSPIACEALFQENGVPFRKRDEDGFAIYESEGLTVWCGDFFGLPARAWDGVTALYDRAALIALPEELRRKYARFVLESWKHPGEMLVITLEYPAGTLPGPPFSVSEIELREYYGEHFSIEKAASRKDPNWEDLDVTENVYRLRPKAFLSSSFAR